MDDTNRPPQNDGTERITAENMALLCSKNIKLDLEPVHIPDTTIGQVSVILCMSTRTVMSYIGKKTVTDQPHRHGSPKDSHH